MQPRIMTASLAVAIAVVALVQPLPAPAATPRATTAPALTFVDLGAGFYPNHVNNSGVTSGKYNPSTGSTTGTSAPGRYRPRDAGGSGVWVDGKLRSLPLGGGYGGGPVVVTDSGVLAGVVFSDSSPGVDVVTWHAPYTSVSTLVADRNTYSGDEKSGTMAIGVVNSSIVSIIGPTGVVLRTLPKGAFPSALNATEFVGRDSAGSYIEQIASANRTTIGFYPSDIAPDGAIVGFQLSGSEAGVLRLPDGTEKVLPIDQPGAVDARHDVMSSSQVLLAGATTPMDATALIAKGWTQPTLTDMSNNGIIVGYGDNPAGALHGFMLRPQSSSITGQVLRGKAPNTPFTPKHAAAGITVTAVGRTAAGAPVRVTDVTDSSGRYTLDTPPGKYTVTFPSGLCASVPGKTCVRTAKVTVTAASPPVLDAVALAALLHVTVTLAPRSLTLPFDRKTSAAEPKKVAVTLTVKNVGVRDAEKVRAPAELTRSYNPVNVVQVPQIPVTQTAGPIIASRKSAAIGTLAPGKSKTVTYSMRATGDGVYDIEGLVIGSQQLLGRVAAVGKSTLRIGAPMLVMHLAFGRGAKGVNGRALIQAGTPFTIDATLENKSFTKELFVHPPKVTLNGNAAGGVFVSAGSLINNPANPTEVQVSQYFTIAPRKKVHAEIIVRTSRTSADVQNSLGSSIGGTRAVVSVAEPVVNEVTDNESVGKVVPANEVFTTGENQYEVGLDDASMRAEPEPKTFLGYTLAISVGTMQALWNLTIGGAIGLYDGLKSIATSGALLKLPRSIINYMEAEAELWNSIRQGSTATGNPTSDNWEWFKDLFNSALTEAYVHATGVHESVAGLIKSADAALVAHLNRIADDYYSGDWRGAVTEMPKEGTEAAGTLVLGTGLLVRFKPIAQAYEAMKAALFAKFTELLDAANGKLYIGAAEALSTLAKAAPGYEFNLKDMVNYYGLSESQTSWLLRFCKEHELVVTLRSRATESLAWLKKAAVLKPEQIKMKTVAWLDAKWLGYGEQNIGRVILRPKSFLPTESKLIARLRRAGLGPKDAEYNDAITRLRERLYELDSPAEGMAGFIEKANREKKMTLRWNLEENAVNPDYVPNGYTEYGFRLAQDAESGSGNLVVQFKVGKTWRSVTGDVDLLSIVSANGSPLSQARRVAIYKLIAKGPLGLMHPAADTWTQLTKVGGQVVDSLFNFDKKVNEFTRGGTVAQFAPDLKVRAVTFNKNLTQFSTPEAYRIGWNGGYNQVAGPPLP